MKSLALAYGMNRRKKMAAGGRVESGYQGMPAGSVHYDDLVDRIIERRQAMSEGGMVANGGDSDFEDLADSRPNNFDDLALRDDLESTNSGAADGDFLGNEQEDMDRADIVSRVMRSRSKKDRMPRPA